MADSQRGPIGDGTANSVKDGKTSALLLAPVPSPLGTGYVGANDSLSFELDNAPHVCVPTTLSRISLAEMRVLWWLRDHKAEIITAEAEFQVDRRAIAGAIAWEGLVNNKRLTNFFHRFGMTRAVGVGKPHLSSWVGGLFKQDTWVYAVEQTGLLPTQSKRAHESLLERPASAIRYIAAIMDLVAIMWEVTGSKGKCDPPLRNNPPILAYVLNGQAPTHWKDKVKSIPAKIRFRPVLTPCQRGLLKNTAWTSSKTGLDFPQ